MRLLHATLLTALLVPSVVAAQEKPKMFRFSKDQSGKLPAGWTIAKTGTGEGSEWKVVADDSAPSKTGHVLAQTAKGPSPLFNLCVAEGTSYKDVEITVAFKAVAGSIDQGGGVAWRYQDANNYYVARFNPLEANYRVYRVEAGKRKQLATKEETKEPSGKWHTLKIRHVGNQIECYLNDQKLLEATDDVFTKPGKIGLWTKADAETYFDNLEVRPAGK